ncbi:MAG: signal peptidase I [Haloarculaceae archaeon]
MIPERVAALSPGWRRALSLAGAVVLLLVVALFVAVAVPGAAGADESYVVLSDSMSPAIGAGSVVFVSNVPPAQITEGDVITFRQSGGTRVTHRVIEVIDDGDGWQFRTKGDANEDPDPGVVAGDQVIGTVSFHVPLIGYVVEFANSGAGTVALVVVPAVLLVVSELWSLYGGGDGEAE